MDQRSGDGWFSGWYNVFVINKRYFNADFFLKYSMRGLLQHWTKSSIILTSKEESVWWNRRTRKRTVSFVAGRLPTWSTINSGSLGAKDSVENCTDLFNIVLRNEDIQEFDSKWDGFFIVYDENPTWWHLGRIVHIKNTRVWKAQDRIGIVWRGDSSEEVRTWLS